MKTDKKMIIIPDFMILLKAIQTYDSTNLTQLHIKTEITYCHLHYIKNVLLEKQWIKEQKEGVKKLYSLTEKGTEVVEAINNLLIKMNITDETIISYRRKGKTSKEKISTSESEEEVIKQSEDELVEQKELYESDKDRLGFLPERHE